MAARVAMAGGLLWFALFAPQDVAGDNEDSLLEFRGERPDLFKQLISGRAGKIPIENHGVGRIFAGGSHVLQELAQLGCVGDGSGSGAFAPEHHGYDLLVVGIVFGDQDAFAGEMFGCGVVGAAPYRHSVLAEQLF